MQVVPQYWHFDAGYRQNFGDADVDRHNGNHLARADVDGVLVDSQTPDQQLVVGQVERDFCQRFDVQRDGELVGIAGVRNVRCRLSLTDSCVELLRCCYLFFDGGCIRFLVNIPENAEAMTMTTNSCRMEQILNVKRLHDKTRDEGVVWQNNPERYFLRLIRRVCYPRRNFRDGVSQLDVRFDVHRINSRRVRLVAFVGKKSQICNNFQEWMYIVVLKRLLPRDLLVV